MYVGIYDVTDTSAETSCYGQLFHLSLVFDRNTSDCTPNPRETEKNKFNYLT